MRYRRQKSKILEIRERINKLVQDGYSYREIAVIVGLKSHQLVLYHLKRYRKLAAKGRN